VSLGFAKNYFKPDKADLRLADLVDFFAFHYYDDDPYDSGRYAAHWYYGQGFPADLRRAIAELAALKPQKPIVITELGFPTGAGAKRSASARTKSHAVRAYVPFRLFSRAASWPACSRPIFCARSGCEKRRLYSPLEGWRRSNWTGLFCCTKKWATGWEKSISRQSMREGACWLGTFIASEPDANLPKKSLQTSRLMPPTCDRRLCVLDAGPSNVTNAGCLVTNSGLPHLAFARNVPKLR
jgi:hypothetical protein